MNGNGPAFSGTVQTREKEKVPVEGLEQAIESRITPWRVDVSTVGKEQKDVKALGHRSIEEPSQFLSQA